MWASISRWFVQNILMLILETLGKYISVVFEDIKKKKQREIEQEIAKEELEKTLASNPTPEEKAKAYAKYQNSGR